MYHPTSTTGIATALAAVVVGASCAGSGPVTRPAGDPTGAQRAAPDTGVVARRGGECPPASDLVVAATTDVHGRLRGWDYYANAAEPARGLSRAATIVDSLREVNPGRVVLVDAGDLLQGNPLTYVAARVSADTLSPVVAAMNAMQYDAAAIGNHEYNYGVALLDGAVRQARFAFLSANTYRVGSGARAYPAMATVERAGVKVGIVGATTPGAAVWDRDNVAGKLAFRDIVPDVRTSVDSARRAGAEAVVVVLHSGLDEPSSYDTISTGVASENVARRVAREVRGIDLLVFGHSHKELSGKREGSTLLLQPKNWATSVGVAHLPLVGCPGARHVDGERATSVVIQAAGHAEQQSVVAATERAHREAVAYAMAAIGTTPVAWRGDSARVVDTPLIDFILEVERKVTGAELASTAAFSLDAKLNPGAITVAQLAELYPYDNTLRAVRISGRQLREYLEYSSRYYRTYTAAGGEPLVDPEVPGYNFDIVAGADYVLDLAKPVGARVTKLTVKGRPVAPGDSFTMALNNYRQTGGGGFAMLHGAPVVYDRQQEIRQLLIDEVRLRKTIRPQDYFERNWRLVPAAAVSRAYAAGRRVPGEGEALRSVSPPPSRAVPAARPTSGGAPSARSGQAPPPGSSPDSTAVAASESRPAPLSPATPPPPGTIRLRVIATNDFHGALEPRPDSRGIKRGGAAAVAATIARAKRECGVDCETLVVDGGDQFQGTPASNLAFGRPVVATFNHVGYAAAALGNHEFDWGRDTLRALMRDARYAFLGANVRYADGRDVEWIRNDTVVRRGALKIGIVGVASVLSPWTTKATVIEGLRFDDPAPVVDSAARALRTRGADAVIVLAHDGAYCESEGFKACKGEIIDFARRLTERVDAIVSGHTHSLLDVSVRGVPIVQARSSGRAVAILDLDVPRGGRGTSRSASRGESAVVPRAEVRDVLPEEIAPDPGVDSIVRRAVAAVWPRISAPVGTIAVAMRKASDDDEQGPLGNFIADAHRWAGKGDIAVMNNGGIRASLPSGPATYGTLFEVAPFGNVLYRITAKGAAVREFLERRIDGRAPGDHVSGITIAYDPSRPAGSRIVSATLSDGRTLADSATYSIVMNDFIEAGSDGRALARAAIRTENTSVTDLDALIGYVKAQRGPVQPPADQRFRTVPASIATP